MGGVVNSIFGSGGGGIKGTNPIENVSLFPTSQWYVNKGLGISTPYSELDANSGALSVDPTGRNLNLASLANYAKNIGETRESLLGNQGAFMQARVNPMLEKLAAGRGLLNREVNRTGVRGTLRNRELESYDIAGERAVADQRALATNETLNALNVLDQGLFQAGTGVGTNLFNQELQSLGLSADTVARLKAIAANLTTGSASTAASSSSNAAQLDQARQENILGTLGSLFTGFGGFGA